MDAVIISRAEARAKGLKKYFDGLECSNGHIALRSVANGGCIACAYEAEKRYKAAHPEKMRDKWRTYEQNASPERQAQKRIARKKWEDAHPGHMMARTNKWKAENPEKVAATNKKWRKENSEKNREKLRSWRARNVEHVRKVDGERVAKWRAANPEWARQLHTHVARRRRARKLNAPGSHTAQELMDLFDKQKGKCVYCLDALGRDKHLDHIEPISKGGSNDIANLQWLCPTCNRRKGAKDPIAFANQHGRLI